MLLDGKRKEALNAFFQHISPQNGKDKAAKIEQILAYLEIIHAQLRKYSTKRPLVCIECGAGNAYLSFLVYYFYTVLEERPIIVHCLDTNSRLMEKARQRAHTLQFDHMHFHACDIADYTLAGRVNIVYSLHACDSATDKTLYLGLRKNAICILSVACCQHGLMRQSRGHPYKKLTQYRVFKEKMVYMIGDALRALLLEMRGYKVDILEFASSRYTDKNIMLRARKGQVKNKNELEGEYVRMCDAFHVTPPLDKYLQVKRN